jgi:hypothetical protein
MAVLTARHMPSFVLGTVEPAAGASADGGVGGAPRAVLTGDHLRF